MQIDDDNDGDDTDDGEADDTDGLFKMEEEDDVLLRSQQHLQKEQQQKQQNRQQPYIPAVNIHDGVNVESVLPTSFVGSPATRNVYMSSPAPPLAPDTLVSAQADILADVYLEESVKDSHLPVPSPTSTVAAPVPSRAWSDGDSMDFSGCIEVPTRSSSQAPPSFSDLVKRSTRFITSVPAHDVLQKLSYTLEGNESSLYYVCCFHFTLMLLNFTFVAHRLLLE